MKNKSINWTGTILWFVITMLLFCYYLGVDSNPKVHSRQWGGPLITEVTLVKYGDSQVMKDFLTGLWLVAKLCVRFFVVAGLESLIISMLIYHGIGYILRNLTDSPPPQQLKHPYTPPVRTD